MLRNHRIDSANGRDFIKSRHPNMKPQLNNSAALASSCEKCTIWLPSLTGAVATVGHLQERETTKLMGGPETFWQLREPLKTPTTSMLGYQLIHVGLSQR